MRLNCQMDLGPALPTDCLAARQRLSLRLDGELSERDELRLERHLDGCAACAAWAAEQEGVVSVLRGAGLARPARDLRVPRQRLFARHVGAAAVAAVAAVAVAVLSLRVDSTPLLLPQLSPLAVRSQLTLKERQLNRIDEAKPEPGQNVRPSVPSGALTIS